MVEPDLIDEVPTTLPLSSVALLRPFLADHDAGMNAHGDQRQMDSLAARLDEADHRVAGVVHDIERARRHRLHARRDADRHGIHLDAIGGKEALLGRDHARPHRRGGGDLAERHLGGGERRSLRRAQTSAKPAAPAIRASSQNASAIVSLRCRIPAAVRRSRRHPADAGRSAQYAALSLQVEFYVSGLCMLKPDHAQARLRSAAVPHSALMFAALMMGHHFSISDL